MTKSKRGERGSSSSSVSSNTELKKARMNEEEEETNSLRDLIQNLTANMESNFAKLHEELCGLRQEMKEEIDMLKSNIKGVGHYIGPVVFRLRQWIRLLLRFVDSDFFFQVGYVVYQKNVFHFFPSLLYQEKVGLKVEWCEGSHWTMFLW